MKLMKLPGTKFVTSFIVNGREGKCGFDAIGNCLQDAGVFFSVRRRNLGAEIIKELCNLVDDSEIQRAMARVECWHVDAIGLKAAEDYKTLHLLPKSSSFGWATTFDFQLLATLPCYIAPCAECSQPYHYPPGSHQPIHSFPSAPARCG